MNSFDVEFFAELYRQWCIYWKVSVQSKRYSKGLNIPMYSGQIDFATFFDFRDSSLPDIHPLCYLFLRKLSHQT